MSTTETKTELLRRLEKAARYAHLSFEVVYGLEGDLEDFLIRLLDDGEPPEEPSPIVLVN